MLKANLFKSNKNSPTPAATDNGGIYKKYVQTYYIIGREECQV